jgi:hypothetical protein
VVINCAVNKSEQFAILKILIFTRTPMPRLRQNDRERAMGMVQPGKDNKQLTCFGFNILIFVSFLLLTSINKNVTIVLL